MRRTLPLALLCILASPLAASAQIAMPDGVALSPFPVLQTPSSFPTFADAAGGVWSVFIGAHAGSALYAQHVRDDGSYAPQFSAAAMALTHSGTQVNGLSAAPDGLDGAVVSWFGVTPNDSTSQFIALRFLHIQGDGVVPATFRDTGVVVSNIASAAMIVGDNQGGAYVVWEELKGASNPDIYAQHYDYWGNALWTPSGSPTGVPVCGVVGIQRLRALHADGAGGAYAVWTDQRAAGSAPLYVARLGANGVAGAPWTTNGVRVTAVAAGIRIVGSTVSPGGGLWLAWRDLNVANQAYGQHIAPNASFRWNPLGAILATVTPLRVDLVAGPSGHVFATWGGSDIRCSRMDSTGVRVWSTEPAGRIIVTPPTAALVCRSAADGANGQRIAWSVDNAGQNDVRILHVDAAAAPRPGQPADGELFEWSLVNEDPVAWFAPSGSEPLVAWLEAGQLRIRRLPSASLGVEPASSLSGLALAAPSPHPMRGSSVMLNFSAPVGEVRVELYDTSGRRVARRDLWSTGGAQRVRLDEEASLPPGVYALKLSAAGRSVSRRVVRVR